MGKLIPKDNLSYSVLLSIDSGKSKGSGFRMKFRDNNYLITAKHVIFNNDGVVRGKILTLTSHSVDQVDLETLIIEFDLTRAKIYQSKKSDACAILIGNNIKLYDNDTPLKDIKVEDKRPTRLVIEDYIKIILEGAGKHISADIEAMRNLSEIRIANDVYLMGYPTSLGLQRNPNFDYSKPLLRKGIIAGINLKENTFIIDCSAYQGNSGGPIIEVCEDGYFRLIGLVSQYIPYETTWYSNRDQITNTELSNSGYSVCVPVDEIINLLSKI